MTMKKQPYTGSGVVVDLELSNDDGWLDYMNPDRPVIYGDIERVGVLPHGMKSGAPSFHLLGRGDDGSTVILSASWKAIGIAALALIARWGTP